MNCFVEQSLCMKKNTITIVTVCYNAEDNIERTMRSVLEQSFDNIEYIIVDGFSTDRTVERAKGFIEKYNRRNVYIISEPDKGIFDAMNKGIKIASGDYINFMNVGDVFYDENVIENLFGNMLSLEYGVVFGDQYINKERKKVMTPFIYKNSGFKNMGICHQCIFVRTDLAKSHFFDTTYKVCADYNMIMTLYREGYKFLDTHKPVAIYDMSGYSAQNRVTQINETALVCGVSGTWEHKIWLIYTYSKYIIKSIFIKFHMSNFVRYVSDMVNSSKSK